MEKNTLIHTKNVLQYIKTNQKLKKGECIHET